MTRGGSKNEETIFHRFSENGMQPTEIEGSSTVVESSASVEEEDGLSRRKVVDRVLKIYDEAKGGGNIHDKILNSSGDDVSIHDRILNQSEPPADDEAKDPDRRVKRLDVFDRDRER